jgi:TetR/AcrR family transcriptional repressor of nem operon
MSDIAAAILDAAERRIREAGYNGFSFRDLAADVGVKSSSVHYHFPTKEQLAAAVARRYTERFIVSVGAEMDSGHDVMSAWRRVFRRAWVEDGRMCLCGILGVMSQDLPEEVASEVRRFFKVGLDALVAANVSRADAIKLLAGLEGAMLMANALGDVSVFDQASEPGTLRPPKAEIKNISGRRRLGGNRNKE